MTLQSGYGKAVPPPRVPSCCGTVATASSPHTPGEPTLFSVCSVTIIFFFLSLESYSM